LISCPVLNAQRSGKGSLSIVFESYVDSVKLKLDSITYKNAAGQNYTVSNLKYYISNVGLLRVKGNKVETTTTFLINEDETESKSINISNIPEGEYKAMSFIIGVDSLHNCSGAQSGALDPVNGMFWAWNTGYIFLKLEGKSPSSSAPGKIFEYHIGGYKSPSNCIRIVMLPFNVPVIVSGDKKITVKVKANIAEILGSSVNVDFTVMPSVTDNHNADIIANNYADMFSIIEIKK
jgi:hypothetical protein